MKLYFPSVINHHYSTLLYTTQHYSTLLNTEVRDLETAHALVHQEVRKKFTDGYYMGVVESYDADR